MIIQFLLQATLAAAQTPENPFGGYNCPAECRLPSCKCATRDPPVQDPPQFISLQFDDSIQASVMPQANGLFANRRNPNGCPAKATWFAQAWYSDPFLATKWYAEGNEIADHSVTHTPPSTFSYEEFEGFRAWANGLAGIPRGQIKGGRFPLRNYTVEAFNNLRKMGFEWDATLAASANERIWPYTMDYGVVTDCGGQMGICGKQLDAKGLWEVPMYSVQGGPGGTHLMDVFNDPSISNPMDPEEVTNIYRSTFDSHYANGRVPFGVYLHPVWIGPANPPSIPEGSAKRKALNDFLDYAMSRPNVWMVTPSQLIQYMKNPVSASELGSQPYMQCNPNPAPPTNICNGLGNVGIDSCQLPNGTINTCYGCPSEYPSLQNPTPARTGNKCPVPDTCDTKWWDPATCNCLCSSPSCEWNDLSRPIQPFEEFQKNGSLFDPNNPNSPNNPNKTPSKSNSEKLLGLFASWIAVFTAIAFI